MTRDHKRVFIPTLRWLRHYQAWEHCPSLGWTQKFDDRSMEWEKKSPSAGEGLDDFRDGVLVEFGFSIVF